MRKRAPRIPGKIGRVLELPNGSLGSDTAISSEQVDSLSDMEKRTREMALNHEYFFDRDFSADYKKVEQIIRKYNNYAPDDEIRFQIGEIVYSHRKRYTSDFKAALEQITCDAKIASELSDKIWMFIISIDHDFRDIILNIARAFFAEKLVGATYEGEGKGAELELLKIAERILLLFHRALKSATKYIKDDASLTRPKTPYAFEAYKLISLWFSLTGKKAVYAKRLSRDESSHQDSTEFIRLCIKMIDPKSNLANVSTSIVRARKKREEHEKALVSFQKNGLPSDIREIIKLLEG
jgi:hypothetical protein